MTTARTAIASRLHGIYLVTDHRADLRERVAAAIRAGVCAVQFRYKLDNCEDKRALGAALCRLCRAAGVLFIVNDDLALAKELAADGVHLGQEDTDLATARAQLGPDMLIGISTHTFAEAVAAQAAGADYLGFGAMYPTGSKEIRHLAGPTLLSQIRPRIHIPLVAIGGITRDNATPVIDAGADALAVIAAILGHPEPGLATSELKLLFNRRRELPAGNVLTIAGSDSGGGAGIQADLKTITLLGAYGASVITTLTAQNTRGVSGIQAATPDFVAAQLDAVLGDIPIDVVKTGMLFSAEIIAVVAEKLTAYRQNMVVVDPVLIATGGASLADDRALLALRSRLLPLTYLLTPNIPEAEALTGGTIRNEAQMAEAARRLHALGARNVLLKGGHLDGDNAVDLLYDGRQLHRYAAPRQDTPHTHGTGCTLASAIAAFLAMGEPLQVAVALAKSYINAAIAHARPLGTGQGPVNHLVAALERWAQLTPKSREGSAHG